ncbi:MULTISPECIES: hypothetical protein [Bacteroides]|jgi:hypothetical protein|uniref:hypothetical protein n=1 Tax=Bacteroides TaxID=816 RepID=UPI000E4CBF83|nr:MULTISPECIES: hypothetical protein [Bacteroides]QNL37461.1 hypothetical protein H8796_16605 [Bacteroides sp. M10]
MNIIVRNLYVKEFCFGSFREQTLFLDNINSPQKIVLENTYGELYYCYVFYNSIAQEKEFILSFSSDSAKENINICFWIDKNIVIISFDSSIYLIDNKECRVIEEIELTSPLIGLYQINENKMLVLEETYVRTINPNGKIVQDMKTDLIEDFNFQDHILYVFAEDNKYIYKL